VLAAAGLVGTSNSNKDVQSAGLLQLCRQQAAGAGEAGARVSLAAPVLVLHGQRVGSGQCGMGEW
jgi:hypothetical protein